MTGLELPDKWTKESESSRKGFNPHDHREYFTEKEAEERAKREPCPRCGEYAFLICDNCRWSRISESYISKDRDESIVSVYRMGSDRREAIKDKIQYYEVLLFELKKEEAADGLDN